MQKLILLLHILLISTFTFSQQVGEVRTIGRYSKPGEPVNNVIIRVKGNHNPVISDDNGLFTIVLRGVKDGDPYQYESVKKNNYEVLDQSLLGRDIAFSSTIPFTIVLVDKNKMIQERLAMQARFEKKYADQYNKRVADIETEYANKLISLEQKIDSLDKLESDYDLVKSKTDEMIDYYLRMDYDQMDSIDQVITHLIEQGEFEKSKSLILSKGDITERSNRLESKLATVQREKEDLVRDLLNLYEISYFSRSFYEAHNYALQAYSLMPDNYDCLLAACRSSFVTFSGEGEKYARLLHDYVASHYPENSDQYLLSLSLLSHTCSRDSSILINLQKLRIKEKRYGKFSTNLLWELGSLTFYSIYDKQYKDALSYLNWREEILHQNTDSISLSGTPINELWWNLYSDYEWLYNDSGKNKKALLYRNKSDAIYDSMSNPPSDINRCMIERLRDDGDLDRAFALAFYNLEVIAEETKGIKSNYLAYGYKDLAKLYIERNDYENAIANWLHAIEINDAYSQKRNFTAIFDRLDLVELYEKAGKLDLARETIDEIINLLPQSTMSEGLAISANSRLNTLKGRLMSPSNR